MVTTQVKQRSHPAATQVGTSWPLSEQKQAHNMQVAALSEQKQAQYPEQIGAHTNRVPEPLGDISSAETKTSTKVRAFRPVRFSKPAEPTEVQQTEEDMQSRVKRPRRSKAKPSRRVPMAQAEHSQEQGYNQGHDETGGTDSTHGRASAMDRIYAAYDRCMDVLRAKLTRHVALGLLLCVVVFAFLYLPARNLYVAQREQAILTARLDSINEQNQELSTRLNALQTRDGIETEARKRGYVYEGEQLMSISGIPQEQAEAPAQDTQTVEEQDWFTGFLDALFAFNASKI